MQGNGVITVLPQSYAERAVLSAMLRINGMIADIVQIVRPSDFRAYSHQLIFTAILELWNNGEPADLATVAQILERKKQTVDAPPAYLMELWDASPSPTNACYHAQIVRDCSLRYQLQHAALEIVKIAGSPTGTVEETFAEAEKQVFRITQSGLIGLTSTMREAMGLAADLLDRRQIGEIADGLFSGLKDFDRLTGGLHNGELVIIAARPSVGKTSLGLRLAYHSVYKCKSPVFFVSIEQRQTELAERLWCAEAKVNSLNYRRGFLTDPDISRLAVARPLLSSNDFHLDDCSSQTMLRIASNARRLKMKHGIKLAIIDYLQLIDPENRRETRQEQVASISRRLKQLARELDIPIVAMAQLNRGAEEHARPRLSDLRESGAIEQDADVVLLLYVPEENCPNKIGAFLAKQRNGPKDDFFLMFNHAYMRFENYEGEAL